MSSKNSVLTTVAVLSMSAIASAAEKWVLDSSTQAQQIIGVGAWSQGNDIAGERLICDGARFKACICALKVLIYVLFYC